MRRGRELRAGSLTWRAAKMRPQRYGEQQQVKVSGKIDHTHIHDTAPDWIKDMTTPTIEGETTH